jgi:dienelactone hydrolase
MRRRTILAGLAAFSLPARKAEAMPRVSIAERQQALLAHAHIERPEGRGPFPTVLLMHGCGGCKPFQRRYAQAMKQAGAAAIVIDSFAHRGIGRLEAYSSVCTGLRLRGAERAGDLFAMHLWARMQPWADAARITAAGWSHGGWTVMDALALRSEELARETGIHDLPAEPLIGLAGAFLVYPYCGIASLSDSRGWRIAPPTRAIVAGRDSVVGRRRPVQVLERLIARGAPIEVTVFPEATHAFDESEAADMRVRYSEERTRETEGLLAALVNGAAPSPAR